MTMKVVLAEKPSVAQSIARIVGATHSFIKYCINILCIG